MGKNELEDMPQGWGPDTVKATEQFVRDELAGMDGSHDWWHIDRVRKTAIAIAQREFRDEWVGQQWNRNFKEIVELAALLHDVRDWKYSGDADAGAKAVEAFLDGLGPLLRPSDQITARVTAVIKRIGFKDELSAILSGGVTRSELPHELQCVQDADRLDAMGAIGIGRTFCYGGAKGHAMHVPGVGPRENLTKEDYVNSNANKRTKLHEHFDTTVNHFHEKLFKLKGLMKTKTGAALATLRHARMVHFLDMFHEEWEMKDFEFSDDARDDP